MKGKHYVHMNIFHGQMVNPKTCPHLTIERHPSRPVAWCTRCLSIIEGDPDASICLTAEERAAQEAPAALEMRGEQVSSQTTGKKLPITRVDVTEIPTGIVTRKFAEGWFERKPGTDLGANQSDWSLDDAVAWLKAKGYNVRRWPSIGIFPAGARAWLGKILPVRTVSEIYRLRIKLHAQPIADVPKNNIDLAYDE